MACAKCTAIVKAPLRPVSRQQISAHYALGVYRWRGDPDALNPLSEMIRWLKGNQGEQVCSYLAYLLVASLRGDTGFLAEADVIVPVPADPGRREERGFDNMAVIVDAMESFCLVPQVSGLLLKIRPTRDLRLLGRAERRAELAGSVAFDVHKEHQVRGATVLLVDDVATYGTTLNVCAGVLKSAGAGKVLAATLARAESTKMTERLQER